MRLARKKKGQINGFMDNANMQKLQIWLDLYTWAFQLSIWETTIMAQHISAQQDCSKNS